MPSRAKDRSTGALVRWIFALALVAVAAACSSVRVGYNSADTLLLYTFDRYFDLDAPQQTLLREKIRALVAWHRATQLRGYADLLEAASRQVEGHIAADDVLAFNLEMNRRLVLIGDHAAPGLATLALSLEPFQVERFATKLADDDAKMRREVSASDGRPSLERREKHGVERAEEWFGSVSPQQLALIRQALATRPDSDEWWQYEREQRRSDLLHLVQQIQFERPSIEEGARRLRDYFAHLAEPADAERRARMAEYRRGNAELIAALINAASAEQKATLLKKLRGYADDCLTLAASAARG